LWIFVDIASSLIYMLVGLPIPSVLASLGSWVAVRGRLGGRRVILHEARSAESRWPRGHG
jgi:hypothetical protein